MNSIFIWLEWWPLKTFSFCFGRIQKPRQPSYVNELLRNVIAQICQQNQKKCSSLGCTHFVLQEIITSHVKCHIAPALKASSLFSKCHQNNYITFKFVVIIWTQELYKSS
ncbi:hypothetical protein T4B_11729 [Trichinella pseudospiralis]|uniref:C2H2-type domain-containing protein n=1 Tax=Trichinella pseudospiralis TaxID=6337 RepID=A0A0V1HH10_TRIPS|nr:hypothetical protein T4A_10123 [Trichinella pseudospiralis]KRZ10040.1 hypothetical protein T4B_11729 [Trichinella pseudospiralis]